MAHLPSSAASALARLTNAALALSADLTQRILFRVRSPAKQDEHRDPSQEITQAKAEQLEPNHDLSSEHIILDDGRTLGIAYYGSQNGPAVFYLHGFPGSRLSGMFFDQAGKSLGARIIAVDRPGVGLSSPQPGRTALGFANDVLQVARHLQLSSFGVLGVSGGAPYALACAHALPEEKLKAISILAGMGPIDIGTKGMHFGNWLTFKTLIYCPAIVRWLQRKLLIALNKMPKEKLVDVVTTRLQKRSRGWFGASTKDVEYMKNPAFFSVMLDLYLESYKQGVEGYMEDGRVLTTDLGFRLEDIRVNLPVQLWYSKSDTNVPMRMGEAVAARLRCETEMHVVEDESHQSMFVEYAHDALASLLEKM